jgi:hypothetical protein
VQNEPNLVRLRRIANPLFDKDLRKKRRILARKNEPKRTQTKPIRPPFFAHQSPPKPKRTQTNPKQSQFPKNPRIKPTVFYTKGYEKDAKFSPTRTNPIYRGEAECEAGTNPISKARKC